MLLNDKFFHFSELVFQISFEERVENCLERYCKEMGVEKDVIRKNPSWSGRCGFTFAMKLAYENILPIPEGFRHDPKLKDNQGKTVQDYLKQNNNKVPEQWQIRQEYISKGIDVSKFQGIIDWKRVKDQGIEFAILQCGYGSDFPGQSDTQFQYNVKGCIQNQIPYGVYLYSYATELEGKPSIMSEVEHVKKLLNGKKPFCVYISIIDDKLKYLGGQRLTEFALKFCQEISKLGYKAGVYSNQWMFQNCIYAEKIHDEGYQIWCQHYGEIDYGYIKEKPQIKYFDIWQYTARGYVQGIEEDVCMNLSYIQIDKPSQQPDQYCDVNISYIVLTEDGWSEQYNNGDFASKNGKPITGIVIGVDKGILEYGVHFIGEKDWLHLDTGYNIDYYNNVWACNGEKIIDAIQIFYQTPDNIEIEKEAIYSVNDYPVQHNEKQDNLQNGYAGIFGTPIKKFQVRIRDKIKDKK